jgi:hypothetical protein
MEKHWLLIKILTFYTLSLKQHLSQKITLHRKDAPSPPLQLRLNHFSLLPKMTELWPNGTNVAPYY